ncbi:hypothetical protein QN277_029415 [Acacia crassicarpa]|uniref:Uncharacterized protein n=1 Tax=Acacia crassicarpa TaxID=499986 RepID=A0AAE1J6Z3_9FABA|nr:hypothetical protein QN277_029415 [Acacia crassicarpa]
MKGQLLFPLDASGSYSYVSSASRISVASLCVMTKKNDILVPEDNSSQNQPCQNNNLYDVKDFSYSK